ncbi:MAG: hypothetical protein FWE11_00515 [Defluviitaleaceae bacterium]|nr:hypothetical protein [Defluviitaleaceae bacterium]
MNKSIFGLNENIVAALSYVLGPLSGLFVLVAERENKNVRFHALQSTLWFLFLWVVYWVVGLITGLPLIGWLLSIVVWPVMWVWRLLFVSSKIFLILRAALGHQFKLPYVGDVALNQVSK